MNEQEEILLETLRAKVQILLGAIHEVDLLRLTWVETQMEVSCRAKATVLRRSGRLGEERMAERELLAAKQHKETAAALRNLAAIVEEE